MDGFGNRNANNTKVILHVDTSQEVADCINGHLIILPPAEAVELDTFIADAVLQHMGDIYGIVEVPVIKTKGGSQWDVEKAIELATAKLDQCEDASVKFYVRQQLEDRIAAGKPALAPNGRALAIITKKKISLRDEYGLSPVGWKDYGADKPNVEGTPAANETALQALVKSQAIQLEQQGKALADLGDKFEKMLAAMNGESTQA